MGSRSVNQIYHATHIPDFLILLRNFIFSDDIAFRFSDSNWEHYPLQAEEFVFRLFESGEKNVCLGMDFESFGEHQDKNTGIFEFLEALPNHVIAQGHGFATASELFNEHKHSQELDVQNPISWADHEKDLSAWKGSSRQREALEKVYELEEQVLNHKDSKFLEIWSRLQSSDHFYYMADKTGSDAQVHQHFNPFNNSELAYAHFMNLLADFQLALNQ